jgi:hypothetical protein
MIKTFAIAIVISGVLVMPITAEQTWTGKISDSACNKKHQEAAENEGVMPDKECTEACVRGGSLYVLVADDKVFQIANQKDANLVAQAGQRVKVTGELKDKTITISKIERVAE